MKSVIVYTTDNCSHCASAKMLLDKHGASYDVINLSRDPDSRDELVNLTGMYTFPQIVIEGEPLGGFDQLLAAHRSGRLAELLAEPGQSGPEPTPAASEPSQAA
jgi:glutaredoxin 3